jgi:hypothetical protein
VDPEQMGIYHAPDHLLNEMDYWPVQLWALEEWA